MEGEHRFLLLPLPPPSSTGHTPPPHLHRPQGTLGEELEEGGICLWLQPAAALNIPHNMRFVTLCRFPELYILREGGERMEGEERGREGGREEGEGKEEKREERERGRKKERREREGVKE